MASSRKKKKHPGITLLKPEPQRGIGWRARIVRVDTCKVVDGKLALSSGKSKKETLPAELTTKDQREAWAVTRSEELANRIGELQRGAPKATGASLKDTVAIYYDAHPKLRDKTLTAYRGATDKLVRWAAGEKLPPDKLGRADLMKFRAFVESEPKRSRVPGGKRGEVQVTDKPRSTYTINRELRGVRTVLGYLVDADQFPRLTHDDLRRALKRRPVAQERIEYLRAAELKKLIDAALGHDAEVFAATRDEHAGKKPLGTTPKYEPVAQFTAFMMLTGCRLAEGLTLNWAQVDLDALDHEGNEVGEIHLKAAATKTHKARTIGLEVSPTLRTMLVAMREVSGGKGCVFGLTPGEAEAAGKRLKADYTAPAGFTWQALRRTCGTFLTNAPGIFGSASAYRSAKQLGHSVQIAEKHYLGLVRGIPVDAKTLEDAMQIKDSLASVIARVKPSQPSTEPIQLAG